MLQSLGRVRVFVEVARQQSFVAAGRVLGISGPAASKQVQALEDELGVRLFHRTTRVITLTDAGAVYYERARIALEELQDAASDIREMKALPKGPLKISAPLSFSHLHLLPVFSGFARKYPDVHLDISLEDRTVDVIGEGFDVVIRIGVPQDSSLIMRPLADCPLFPVASPDYLQQVGVPVTPADLRQHRWIGYTLNGGATEWRYQYVQGQTGYVRGESVFRASTAELMLHAALDGVGVAILPGFSCMTYLNAGHLVRLLPDYESAPKRQVFALIPPGRHRSTRIRLFLDWLDASCKGIPA